MEGTSRTLPYTITFVGLLGIHSLGRNPKFMATAVDLGREFIRRRISLAYGGGNVGLQGAVASTVFTNGGLVRGFIPGYIATRRVYGPTYGVEHTVSSNYYKYFEMNHAMEAFIILPGGVDTMEGLFTLISWASEGLHNRPIGLLNIDSYFNNLLKFLDDAVRQNIMASSQRKLFISSFFVGKPRQKFLCQGLYIGHVLESMDVASDGKKYEERYWLYYLSSKGENRASPVAEEEGSSNEVLDVALKKASKRKQVKKSNEDMLLEFLSISPPLEFEIDDEDITVFKAIFSNPAGNPIDNIDEDVIAAAEDFQTFLENSSALETTYVETLQENSAIPQIEEQIQTTAEEEEIIHSLTLQVQEILTTTCEISTHEAKLENQKCAGENQHLEDKSEEHVEEFSRSPPQKLKMKKLKGNMK
ncbi:unnamed protein product [Cuscuta campestris]|uniref:cytokinin riboside 5'-monophosphate phosphoribohydrolase n=1 Tax=Cuscuta campestris TaxID=132261 RepID=A0A484NAV6_9ASTE|nr:unnamed protein product [Cuscuta campestris]